MDYSLAATYLRTGLLLGTIRGESAVQWAERAIEADPAHPDALLDVVSVPATDLSGLRHALWPLVAEPEPLVVLETVLGHLHRDLVSGQRTLTDTLTILRQMRSMLRLPPALYAGLNGAMVAHGNTGADSACIPQWLQQFAAARMPTPSEEV